METINSINFEDLFDFSPEPPPVDRRLSHEDCGEQSPPPPPPPNYLGSSTGSKLQPPSSSTQKLLVQPPLHQSSSPSITIQNPSPVTANKSSNVFADFDAVASGAGSSSHPHHHGHSSSGHPGYLDDFFKSDADFDSAKKFVLSASVPTAWGSSTTSASTSAETGGKPASFTVGSVGQLLDELPDPTSGPSASLANNPGGGPQPQVVKSKRGRKPGQKNLKTDMKSKLERSRQSARECRARKKLRYQYLDDMILERERANIVLRKELLKYQEWCHEIDKGRIPDGLQELVTEFKKEQAGKQRPT